MNPQDQELPDSRVTPLPAAKLVLAKEVASAAPARVPAAPGASLAQGGANTITLAFVVRAVVRWWRLAVPTGLALAVLAGAAAHYVFRPTYRAEAWVKIEERRPTLVFPDQFQSTSFARTQLELIKSPMVMGQVVERPEIAKLPEIREEVSKFDWLAQRVSAKAIGNSELFKITFDGPNADNAALIVNAILENFINIQSEMTDEQTRATIKVLEQERDMRTAELVRLRAKLKTLAKEVTGKDPTILRKETVVTVPNQMDTLESKLVAVEVEREVLEARLTATQELAPKSAPTISKAALRAAVEQNPEVVKLTTRIETIQERIAEHMKASRSKDDDPTLHPLRSELTRAENTLDALRQKLTDVATDEVQRSHEQQSLSTITNLETQVASQRALEELLKQRIAEERKKLESLGDHSLEFEFARGELLRAEQVHQSMSDRVMALKTEMRAPARITTMQRATVPDAPVEKSPLKKLVAAAAGSFLLPFLLAVVWEIRVRRVATSHQITQEGQLPLLGEIVTLPARSALPSRRAGQRYEQWQHCFEESIDLLRANLTLPDSLRDIQVYAVTSAVSGEGKTSVACQLCVSLAKACRERVLIVDADLRSPDVHNFFGGTADPGLADVLSGTRSLSQVLLTNWSKYVHVLPAGRLQSSPHALLTLDRWQKILASLRRHYRYIVIDTPPVLCAGESLLLAKTADGTVLCTMRDVSRAEQVKSAYDRLAGADARTLGAVLSGIPAADYAYRYGTYY